MEPTGTGPNTGRPTLPLPHIIDFLPDPTFVIDVQGTVIAWNKAIENLTGIQAEDIIGKGEYEYAIPFYGTRRPILIDFVNQGNPDAARTYKYTITTDEHLVAEAENVIIGQKSYYLWAAANRLCDSNGECIGALEVFRDITEIKEAEEALRKSEQRLSAIFSRAAVGLCELSPEGRFTKVNDTYCQILGRTRHRLLSMSLPEVTHPDEVNRVMAALRQVLENGELASLDKQYVRPDGTIVYANCSLTRIDDEQNRPQAIMSVTVDMTDRRNANELLEQRVAERTELAEARTRQLQSLAVELIGAEERERQRISALLHEDLQQVLAAARFQVQAVQESLPEVIELSEVEQMLSGAIFTSRRLSHELSPSILHHSGLVAALAWLSRQMHERFGLEVQVYAENVREPNTAYLRIIMFRAAQELLFNVVKHAGVQSAQVHLFASDRGLSISVSDQGRGFEPAILESSAATTGLGLLSLRERASYVGGSFLIESAPGQGSRITITVPAILAWNEPKRAEPVIRYPSTPAAGIVPAEKEPGFRVMLVDDHKVMRQGLIRLITGQPDIQVVGEADSGQEAIELARQIRPDVIVMDVSMPEMDGIEATRRIKNELPETRVIGLSMFEDEHVTKAMRQAGAEALVSKSSSMSELLKAIYGITRNQHRS